MRTTTIRLAILLGSFSGCAGPQNPWLHSKEAERDLARIVASAAWSVPGFLENPQRLVEMPVDLQLKDWEGTWSAVKNRGYTFARVYLVLDPTSITEPNLDTQVVLLRHGDNEEALAEVVHREDFFRRVFQVMGEDDLTREDAFDLCRLYLHVFGNDSPRFSQPAILFSVADIPSEPDEIIPKELARHIAPPITQYIPPNRTTNGRLVSRFTLDCCTWDLCRGTLKRWNFDLTIDLHEWQQSRASVSERTIGHVGSGIAPK